MAERVIANELYEPNPIGYVLQVHSAVQHALWFEITRNEAKRKQLSFTAHALPFRTMGM
jgi:hypothetical protein